MNNMMSSIYRNISGPSTSAMPSSSFGHGDLILDPDYRMSQSGGSDACITIDDSSESDSEVASTSQKSSTTFFVDRVGERPQLTWVKDSGVGDTSPQGEILDVSDCLPPPSLLKVQSTEKLKKRKKSEKLDEKTENEEKRKENDDADSGRKTPKTTVRKTNASITMNFTILICNSINDQEPVFSLYYILLF